MNQEQDKQLEVFQTEVVSVLESIDDGIEALMHRNLAAHYTGAKLSKDGDQWCYLLGDDLMSGIAGFGNTVHEAALNFETAYYKERA